MVATLMGIMSIMVSTLMRVDEFNLSRVLQVSNPNKRQGRKASSPDVYRKKAYPAEREKAYQRSLHETRESKEARCWRRA